MGETIIVKRSVYDAAQELLRGAGPGEIRPLSLAAKKMGDCETSGDKTGYRFWSEVYNFFFQVDDLNLPVEIIES